MADRLILPRPDDFHAHLRRGPAMGAYALRHAAAFGRALVMPNTKPPIGSAAEIHAYRREIQAATVSRRGSPGAAFEALLSFKLLPGMSRSAVLACAEAGAVAAKYYPAGSTTNSEDGIGEPLSVDEALSAMEEAGLVLCVHGEAPDAPALDREAAFLPVFESIMTRHSKLRIVMEHISTIESLDFLRRSPERVAATLTAHHLLCTLEDLIGGSMSPHLFCRPLLKSERHVATLREAALAGEQRLFFGSDSAPHARLSKESGDAPAGIYSAPTAIPALVELFDRENRLGALETFLTRSGATFYGLGAPKGSLELLREAWQVPDELDGAVPLFAGRRLSWRLGRIGD